MGRTDEVQVCLEINARLRQLDPKIKITAEADWETRGNGLSGNYEGGIVHHTATPSSAARPFPTQSMLRTGRSDLPGPLCNYAGPYCTVEAPWIHLMAAFPANHAGASGGRSMGPLPRTSLFNPRVLGLEIDYAGLIPMSAGQLYVAKLWSHAVAFVLGRNTEYVRAHMETSITGKWDPGYANGKTIDMATFRREAAVINAGKPAPGPVPAPEYEEDQDMRLIRNPKGTVVAFGPGVAEWVPTANDHKAARALWGTEQTFTDDFFNRLVAAGRAALATANQTKAIMMDLADEEELTEDQLKKALEWVKNLPPTEGVEPVEEPAA
jgi:hypothetical protein